MTLAPRVFRFFFRWHHWVLNRWSKAVQALGQYDAAREWLLKAKGAAEAQEESAILDVFLSQPAVARLVGEKQG